MRIPCNAQGTIVAELTNPKDPKGKPGEIDPDFPATWTPDVEGVVELTPDINGTSVHVKTLPPPDEDPFHAVTITYEADADMGDGTESIMGTVTLIVYNPDARDSALTVTLTPSDFVPIPEEPVEPVEPLAKAKNTPKVAYKGDKNDKD